MVLLQPGGVGGMPLVPHTAFWAQNAQSLSAAGHLSRAPLLPLSLAEHGGWGAVAQTKQPPSWALAPRGTALGSSREADNRTEWQHHSQLVVLLLLSPSLDAEQGSGGVPSWGRQEPTLGVQGCVGPAAFHGGSYLHEFVLFLTTDF